MDLEQTLATIRTAVAPDATSEARAAGAAACRALLSALEGTPAAPLDVSAIANAVSVLRGVPPDQLLDLAIAKLRAALPASATAPEVRPIRFNLVPVPPSTRS